MRVARLPLRAFAFLFSALALVFLVLSFFRVVPPGTAGVPVTFGSTGSEVGPGLHLVWPVTGITNISIRTQTYTMAGGGDDPPVQVLGRDGTSATVNASLLYRVDRANASDVYENVGTGYTTTIVTPTARTCTRGAFARYDLVEAATTAFADVEQSIADCIEEKLGSAGITVRDFQLRELTLSKQLQTSLDANVAAQSVGADSALAEEFLRLQYVQALRDLVTSKNASTVVLPFSNAPLLTIPTPGTGG
jgi:regulator of protease activity HflC (stomatin/prohibitin superfamily)